MGGGGGLLCQLHYSFFAIGALEDVSINLVLHEYFILLLLLLPPTRY